MRDTHMRPLKMEIKREQDVEWCGVNKWEMEADISQKTVDEPNNSGSFPFQDEYLHSKEFKVKLEDDSAELNPLRNTDVKKWCGVNKLEMEADISQKTVNEPNNPVSFPFQDEYLRNCSRTKCLHSDCHVGVEQGDMNDVYNTQQSVMVKHDVFSESISDHKSIGKNGNICFLDNIKLRSDTVKQKFTDATESVLDRNSQTVNADIITNQIDDSMKFHDGSKCQSLKFGSDDSNQPVLHVFTDTDRRASKEIYNCTVCYIEFTDSDQLMAHKQIHTREHTETDYHKMRKGEKRYVCDDCGYSSNYSKSLMKHKKIHTGEERYKCDVCDYSSSKNINLKRHRRIHTGETPYKCDVCGLCFTQNHALKQHNRIHTGEKPYKCDVCDLDFKLSGHLKKHKRIHTGEKPYKCDVCDYSSSQNGNLKKHRRIHTGEKPYKCDVCDLGFAQSNALKQHKRIHSREEPYKCDVCDYSVIMSRSSSARMRCVAWHYRATEVQFSEL